uniref:Single domain-containing protein n=1 Tax=Stomoxys calcitrans TaxID=35570 RepID=A0A1I8NLK4_STOCA
MKLFIFAFILMALGAVTLAQEHLRYFKHLDHPGKCVFEDLVLSPGEEGQPRGSCLRLSCKQRDGLGSLKLCSPAQPAKPNCKVGGLINPSGVYPSCCERQVICK